MKRQSILLLVISALFLGEIAFALPAAELIGVWGGSFESNSEGPGYRMGPTTQYSPDLLEDNLLSTSLTILGDEGISDYGAFMLLEFQTAAQASEVHLNISIQSFGYGYSIGTYSGMSADDSFSPNYSDYSNDIQTISGFFDGSGNNFLRYGTGDYPTGKQWQTISDIALSDNRYQFLLWGPYLASELVTGDQGIEVFEAHVTYQPIPAPSSILLVSFGIGCVPWIRRQKSYNQ